MWVQAGDQPALEQQFGLTSFPAVVGVSAQLKKYAVMKDTLSEKTLVSFLNAFISGKAAYQSLEAKPVFVDSAAWNIKDADQEKVKTDL